MCNENVNENEQIRPVYMRMLEMPKSERIYRLAEENVELSEKIRRLEKFLNNNQERFASEKQVELMRGQLEAMENYKRFLSCRIADLALSDLEPSEKEKE